MSECSWVRNRDVPGEYEERSHGPKQFRRAREFRHEQILLFHPCGSVFLELKKDDYR